MTHMNGGLSAPASAVDAKARSWGAQMIAPLSDGGQGTRASFVATDFDVSTQDQPAVLHISAQGLYRAFINGKRVGDDLLTPGWTCYDDRIAYQSYDVGPLLQSGQNTIEIWLADGWYRSQILWRGSKIVNCWGDRIAAIAELELGGDVLLKTDATWGSGLLPITQSGMYYGEDYDARHAQLTVSHGVEALAFDFSLLVPHEAAAVKALPALEPIETWQDADATLYDFGQNVAGFVKFTVTGERGATVRVEHSEVLGPNREFDNRNLRTARAESHYTLSGEGDETFCPYFTFMGYRYARITVEGQARVTEVESVPITSVPEVAGGFSCKIPQVNKLVENTMWSQRANFIEIPTDCPQRDERLGWTGDAQVFAGTACWLADSERFLSKFLRDVRHDQRADGAVPHFAPDPTRLHPEKVSGDWAGSTGWGDAITVIPWQLYLHYGDAAVLKDFFPAMVKWVDYIWSLGNGPIVVTHSKWGQKGFTFGDWLQPVGDNRLPRPTIAADCAATLYHFISTDIAANVADIIGQSEAAQNLRERADTIRTAFAHEYISASGRLAHNDQTSYALAVLYDLIPAHHMEAAKAYFRKVVVDAKGLIGTGFIGTPALLPALSKLGMHDLVEMVLLNRDVPGWLYQVDMGATSIWERWDAMGPDGTIYEPEMNSYNHYAYGAVCQWLFEGVAGVTPSPQAPGFDRVELNPLILPQLSPVAAWHECRHGKIEASWQLDGDTVTYDVTLPQGCEGVLMSQDGQSNYALNGAAITIPPTGFVVPSGSHRITFQRN